MLNLYKPYTKRRRFHAFILTLALVVASLATSAQSTMVQFTVLQNPCNNDGVIQAEALSLMVPPISFTWYIGSINVTQTSATLFDTLENYSGAPLYVIVTDASGSSAYGFFNGAPPFTYYVTTTPAVCPALGTAEAIVTGGTPPYTVQWMEDGSGNVVSTDNPADLPAGGYDVLITDAAGCAYGAGSGSFDSVFVENISNIVATVMTTPANCTNGSASVLAVGGVPPYSYEWSNGANSTTINGLMVGSYIVTVTDAQGCYTVSYGYVQQSVFINPNPTVTDATCLEDDGSVIVFGSGGMPPYSYQWQNGETTQTVSNLTAGYYFLTVTDANGCVGMTAVNIGSTTPIGVTYSTTASSCTAPTGSATLTISGGTAPYTVQWYTFPAQSGTTASNLSSGTYGFHVTDALGCVRNGSVYIPPVSVINAYVNTADAMCTLSNGSATIVVTSGATPFSYNWSNGASTSGISNLSTGSYNVTITDALGCAIVKYASVGTNSPISIGLSSTPASCIFANDGGLVATPVGGTAPYTYFWSNGSTTNSSNNLTTGYYSVYVNDAAGCQQQAWSYVGYDASNDDCYCTITGTVYEDQNTNCVHDAGEPGIENIMVHCSGAGYDFTDANGVYSFIVPTGSYTLSESVQYYYPLAACQSNAIAVSVSAASGCVNTVDFANVINPVHDMRIVTISNYNPPIPGNAYIQKVVVTNDGSITENDVKLGYKHDGQLALSSVTPSLFTQPNAGLYPNWYNIDAGFPTLAPADNQIFNVTYNVPTNIPLGTDLVYYDSVAYASSLANWLNDYTPWNNVNTYHATVVGSFDPNYKEVSPQGSGAPGFIMSRDSILTYIVHFQNTGSWAAQKVVIKDTLDANLEMTTLKPGYATHNYEATVSENGEVTFTFNNINLPDSASQPEASQGLVMYSIHLKPNLAEGTQIHNSASIYFDYNAPVLTNTTTNTIDNILSVHEVTSIFDFTLFPNPTNALVAVAVNTDNGGEATLNVHNVLGQNMQSQNVLLKKGKNVLHADISELPSGLYFVELKQGQRSQVQKLNVIK